jgi:DNA-binding NarL/FixJ family response regulator
VYAMCRYPQAVVLSRHGHARYFVLVSRHVRKKDEMSIKVLLADDSHVMLAAIRKRLAEDSRIRLVGAVSSFAAMMQMISDFRPEVLLLDLHLPEERHFTPDFIKSQLGSVPHTLAVSLSNDAEAKALAVSYGAESLLDKMKLHDQMIPAIMSCCKAQEIRYPGRKHPNRC